MVDPYKAGLFSRNPYAKKRPCQGELVVVLDGKMENRKLQLITPISRALCTGEIHELIVTDEEQAGPGQEVNRIAYWGFFEVTSGTVVVAGDEVRIGNSVLGTIAGFDETHMPNHLNIVIKAAERKTGVELGLALEEKIIITKKEEE
ncbi:MAG: hypothetical protein JG781_1816 [Peptococcaceae bacterium]|jgi:hypothetical protein|nr:hypothetical protein [Peptococcaceae bacterium]